MAGSCGTCTMCCKLMAVLELDKPRNTNCNHCAMGIGCKIYDARPSSCQSFRCLWLQSQGQEGEMPLSMRPDKSKIVLHLSPDRKGVIGKVDPGYPMSWHEGAWARFFGLLSEKVPILIETGKRYYSISKRAIREVQMSEADEKGLERFQGFV